jgi:muramoyltetrapeptide carboxypeptidase
LTWQRLEKGDIVDIVAPGSGVPQDVLEAAKMTVQSFGFNPRIPEDILRPYLFHSHFDEARAAQLLEALSAKDSKAVWALRGGYGSLRLVPELMKARKPRRTKLFIGISDMSSVHLFLNQEWKWPSLHASLLDRVARGRVPADIVQEMKSILSGELLQVQHKNLKALNQNAESAELEGPLRGGNLTTLQSHIGTELSPKFRDSILFLEDIGERGYRVDRMLEHFTQSQTLKGCLGVVFGHFTECQEPSSAGEPGPDLVPKALERFAELHPDLPVWTGVESGHGERLRPLPFGTDAVLRNSVLTIQTGVKVLD